MNHAATKDNKAPGKSTKANPAPKARKIPAATLRSLANAVRALEPTPEEQKALDAAKKAEAKRLAVKMKIGSARDTVNINLSKSQGIVYLLENQDEELSNMERIKDAAWALRDLLRGAEDAIKTVDRLRIELVALEVGAK